MALSYEISQNTSALRNTVTGACYQAYWCVVNMHASCVRSAEYLVCITQYMMAQ